MGVAVETLIYIMRFDCYEHKSVGSDRRFSQCDYVPTFEGQAWWRLGSRISWIFNRCLRRALFRREASDAAITSQNFQTWSGTEERFIQEFDPKIQANLRRNEK